MAAQLSMRLLVDTKRNKVVFAEANKDVADFLFSLLALPVGAIVKLLSATDHGGVLGGIAKVHQSLEQLDETFLQPNQEKNSLLNPVIVSTTSPNTLLLPAVKQYYYRCCNNTGNCNRYFTETNGAPCPSCRKSMGTKLQLVDGYGSGHREVGVVKELVIYRCTELLTAECRNYFSEIKYSQCPFCQSPMGIELRLVGADGSVQPVKVEKVGIVKGVVTYTIADDLTVTPMSTISNIVMLNKLNVQDLSILEEKIVKLGLKEGLELLRASLHSKTVLTDVFLPGLKD